MSGRLDDRFKKIVGSFELVPKERVVLAELKILEVHLLHRADAIEFLVLVVPLPIKTRRRRTKVHRKDAVNHREYILLRSSRGFHRSAARAQLTKL